MVTDLLGQLARRLATPLDLDDYLGTMHPLWGTRARGIISSVTPCGVEAASIRIRPGRAWGGHRPGQFVTLGVDVNGVRHHRSFTLTSAPGESTLEITVQATADGIVSRHLVHRAVQGEVVQLSPAAGGVDAVASGSDARLLFVTGGSGVTPCVGILRALDAAGADIHATVLHHATSSDRALFTEELDRLADRHGGMQVHHVISQPDGSHRLSAEGLDRRCPDWSLRHTHVCGPEPMLDAATAIWTRAGASEHLHLERFHPVSSRPADRNPTSASDRPAPVAWFTTSDVVASCNSGTTLLDTAEGAGLRPPTGCRTGICHTCTTPLRSGTVRDLRDGRERCGGDRVQLCVSTAVDDVVLEL